MSKMTECSLSSSILARNSIETSIPDYVLQSCKSSSWCEEKLLKNEVIRRVMAFRGKGKQSSSIIGALLNTYVYVAMIAHETKLKAQQKAVITSADAVLKTQVSLLTESLNQSLAASTSSAVHTIFVQHSAASSSDADVQRCWERCAALISTGSQAYTERKRAIAIESIKMEAGNIYEELGSPAGAPHQVRALLTPPLALLTLLQAKSCDSKSLKDALEQLIAAVVTEEEDVLRRSTASMTMSPADQQNIADVLDLMQMNLQLAAKLAVLKTMTG